MQRWKLTLSYDGSPFVGWQRQDNGHSVQAALEAAWAQLAGHPVATIAAGRTDTGVHAYGQVVHGDMQRVLHADKIRLALNSLLRPEPIIITKAEAVSTDFHARFSATRRHYRYFIRTTPTPDVLQRNWQWHIPQKLDIAAMQQALPALLGAHDFTSFRASQCQAKSALRHMDVARLEEADGVITVFFAARSFLHHQVRNMVGSLIEIGRGRRPVSWLAELLAARDRRAAGATAPAHGLIFYAVEYD